MLLVIIFLVLFLFFFWIILDMKLGKKMHEKNIPPYDELPLRTGNSQFFSHGGHLFDHLLTHIAEAEDHIHMQFYIFREDGIGTKILNKFMEKSQQGLSVRLMVDWFGARISKKMQNKLKNAGVEFVTNHLPHFPFLFFSMQVRNHRKVTIIDGKYGYIGGFNVGDEYLSRDEGMGNWRDYHLFLTGEPVADLQHQFMNDWNQAHARKIYVGGRRYFPKLEGGQLKIQIHHTKGAHVEKKLLKLMEQAKDSILIGTPYFIPGKEMANHLLRFSKKGIRILLLIPKNPDHPLVRDAALPYLRKMIQHGVEVRQYRDGFYHSKILVVDDLLIDIGTANFDLRSFHLNHEVNCIIQDPDWVKRVKKIVDEDFYARSEAVTLASLNEQTAFQRLKERIASMIEFVL